MWVRGAGDDMRGAALVQTASRGGVAAAPTILALAAILALYWPTLRSLIATWASSETYSHCFLIPLISLWLAWRVRSEVAATRTEPSYIAALGLAWMSAMWMLSRHAGIQLGEHLALVGSLPLVIWAIHGRELVRVLMFPLAYLLFMVPFGDVLIPQLMRLTADMTVGLLRLSGVATYREGMLFIVPSGVFEVAKACSGLRYLIASAALGTLYAYLTYRSSTRRLIFIAFALLVPLAANGLRAYLIVLIASVSGMRLAVGVDHFIYGWIFFGLVLGLMFWVGLRFREHIEAASAATIRYRADSRRSSYIAAAAAVLMAGWGPAAVWIAPASHPVGVVEPLNLPSVPGWEGPAAGSGYWSPFFPGARQAVVSYWGATLVHVFAAAERPQGGSEFFSDGNRLDENVFWNEIAKDRIAAVGPSSVLETTIFGDGRPMLIWAWYVIGDQTGTSEVGARLAQLRSLFGAERHPIGFVAVAVPLGTDREVARGQMESFVADAGPNISRAVSMPDSLRP